MGALGENVAKQYIKLKITGWRRCPFGKRIKGNIDIAAVLNASDGIKWNSTATSPEEWVYLPPTERRDVY